MRHPTLWEVISLENIVELKCFHFKSRTGINLKENLKWGMTTQHTHIQRYAPPTVTSNNQHTVHEHSINTWHGLTYAYIHYLTPILVHTHIIMYTHSINTCMTVYECTHAAYQVCRLANSVNHRLWTSPRSIRVKRPFLPAGDTAPHTYSAGPTCQPPSPH